MGIIAPIIMLSFAKSKHGLMNKIYHVAVTQSKHLILFQPAEMSSVSQKFVQGAKRYSHLIAHQRTGLEVKQCLHWPWAKLKLSGQNLGRVFNSRLGHACMYCATAYITKQPNLKLKTWHEQLLGSLPLAFALLYRESIPQIQSTESLLKGKSQYG